MRSGRPGLGESPYRSGGLVRQPRRSLPAENLLPRTSTPLGKYWCAAVGELSSHTPDETTTARRGISTPRRVLLDANPAADAVALI